MQYTGAEIIIKMLEQYGIKTIAGIPGGANLPLYDALYHSSINHILARHEQGAGFIASGMARATGKPAVCFATSGPGATNLVTAIADAYADSIPVIAITGQVSTPLMGTDAFQEVAIAQMMQSITKQSIVVESAQHLLTVLPQAFFIAQSGKPGPVVIDVPKDVQLQRITVQQWPSFKPPPRPPLIPCGEIMQLAQLINQSKRPIIYAGGGIIAAQANKELYQFAVKNSIAVATSLMGLGSFPATHPLSLGMIGMHGARFANMLMHQADLILAFGCRFSDRTTGNVATFGKNACIVHIDIDPSQINKIKPSDFWWQADIGDALKQLIPFIETNNRVDWMGQIAQMRCPYLMEYSQNQGTVHPRTIISAIYKHVSPDTIITTDVGQHQMWVAQMYPFTKPRTFLTSGGLGTMGFGLPAAIGAALVHPGQRVICFSGDGSMLMNIQELATIADLQLPVTIIIMNNASLGLVRQQQELFYGQRYSATQFKRKINFAAIAQDFGIDSYSVCTKQDLDQKLKQCFHGYGSNLIDIAINPEQNVTPMVAPGAANTEMIM